MFSLSGFISYTAGAGEVQEPLNIHISHSTDD